MTSAIREIMLFSERTSSCSSLLMLCSDASFGHAAMARLISSSEHGVAHANGGDEVVSEDMQLAQFGVPPNRGRQ